MSDNDVKDSPSADEIVDDVTEEMGVDGSIEDDEEVSEDETEENPEEDDEASADADEEASDDTDEDEDDQQAEASDDTDQDEDDEDEDDQQAEASDDTDQDKDDEDDQQAEASDDTDQDEDDEDEQPAGVVEQQLAGVDDIIEPDDTGYLDVNADVDIDQFSLVDVEGENKWLNKKNIGIAVAICVVIMGALYFITDDEHGNVYSDIGLLLQGQYLEDMQRRAAQVEEEFIERQEEVIPDYGNLFISGSPREALIELDDQIQYAEVPAGGLWRELRVEPDTVIEDLSIDDDHEITISHPGFEDYEITLTEDMWEPAGADYGYDLSVNLTPESEAAHREFQQRMMIGGDEDEEFERGDERYFGTVDFDIRPAGAILLINSYIARDEDGYPIEAPVELDEYWVLDIDVAQLYEEEILEHLADDEEALEERLSSIQEDIEEAEKAIEEGEEDVDEVDKMERLSDIDPRDLEIDERALMANHPDLAELEEEPRQFPVDRPPDRGDSIQIVFPDDHEDTHELYDYATMLQRAMWECHWTDDFDEDDLDDDEPIQEYCDYRFVFDKDFYDIADYIEWRKEERERVQEERYRATEQLEDLEDEFDEKLQAFGTSIDEVDRLEPEDDQPGGE